jgi:two-component system, NarL family, response regulator DegU
MFRPIQVLIADDHPIYRKGLREVLEADPRLHVVDEVGDGADAVARIRDHRPDVTVMDINMPKMNGLDVVRTLRREKVPAAVVLLTMYREQDLLNEALDLGVRGYVLKDSAPLEIVQAVIAAQAGEHYISPALSSHLISRRAEASALARKQPGLGDLTPAERRVLHLIATCKTSKEIADDLCVSYRTVENHRNHICEKLNIHGSHALLKFAIEHRSSL